MERLNNMKFTDFLFSKVEDIWEDYLRHPFLVELGEGTLDKEKFKNYLIQDYIYLKEYSKVFAIGIVKANTMEEMKFYYSSVKGTMEDETAVHIKYLEGFGYTPKQAENCKSEIENESYTSYMQSIALKGNMKEIAMAVMPCAWGYNYIGCKIYEKHKDTLEGNFYKPWIEEYASKEFTDFTENWIDYVNEICKDISEAEKESLAEIFIRSSIYEMEFWNMAYK